MSLREDQERQNGAIVWGCNRNKGWITQPVLDYQILSGKSDFVHLCTFLGPVIRVSALSPNEVRTGAPVFPLRGLCR